MLIIKKYYRQIIPGAISLYILYFIFAKINNDELWNALAQAKLKLIIFSVLVIFISFFILSLRWRAALKIIGYNIEIKNTFKFYLASVPVAKFSPSNSGDLIRAVLVKNVPRQQALGLVVAENLLDILALILLSIFGSLYILDYYVLAMSITALIFFMLFISLIIYWRPQKIINNTISYKIENFLLFFTTLRAKPLLLCKLLAYSIVSWLFIVLFIKINFLALGANISLFKILAIQPIIILFGLLPITFSGVGLRESAMSYAYLQLVSPATSVLVGLIQSALVAVIIPVMLLPLTFYTLYYLKNERKAR